MLLRFASTLFSTDTMLAWVTEELPFNAVLPQKTLNVTLPLTQVHSRFIVTLRVVEFAWTVLVILV